MPRTVPSRLAAVCASALIMVLATASVALAKGPVADLRVVDTSGRALAERSLGAGTVSVKTSPKATCFGSDNAGSGKPASVKGPTALGLLIKASKSTPSLRPLLITDAFDFGLGLCGIGTAVAKGKASWYLKVNHKAPTVGGDSVKLKRGDEVLWYLASSFPYPDELELVAPERVRAGVPFSVRVYSYDEKGKRRPVAGAGVNGASGPTGADGRTMVTLSRPATLTARHGKDIPSAREAVCIGGKCPRG
jgi:hypothetical protein